MHYQTTIKALVTITLAISLSIYGVTANASTPQIKIYVDEKPITTDVPPYMKNNRTMVPIRFVSEALGAEVSWNALTQGVTIKSSKTTIKMTLGLLKGWVAKLSGADTETTYDMAPEERGGRTFVPLRFVSENLGATVKWDNATSTVNIYSEGFVPTEKPVVEGKKVGEFTVPAVIVEMPWVRIEGVEMDRKLYMSKMQFSDLTEERIKALNDMFASRYDSATGDKVEQSIRKAMAERLMIPDFSPAGSTDEIGIMPQGKTISISVYRN